MDLTLPEQVTDVLTHPVVVGVITALLTALFSVWIHRRNLASTHKQNQRQDLRTLISRYHGRMLEAAVDWDRRMKQLYDGEYQWLDVKGQTRDPEHYYFQSLVYRFLSLLSIARRFEREAYYINSRIAKEKELEFLRYSKSFIWAMTNPKITPNDDMPGIDHFRHDAFRPVLDLCYENIPELPGAAGGGDIIFDYRRFRAILTASAPVLDEPQNHLDTQGGGVQLVATYRSEIDEVLNFFQGLKPNEPFRLPVRALTSHTTRRTQKA